MLRGGPAPWGPPVLLLCPQNGFAWLPLPPPPWPRPLAEGGGVPPGALSEYEAAMAALGGALAEEEEEEEAEAEAPLPPLETLLLQAEGAVSPRFLAAILGPSRDLAAIWEEEEEEEEEEGAAKMAAGRADPPKMAPVAMETPPPPKMAAHPPKMAADPPNMAAAGSSRPIRRRLLRGRGRLPVDQ